MKEGYDGKFIHELLQKWKSENVSVKDGLKKLLHPSYWEDSNLKTLSGLINKHVPMQIHCKNKPI